MIFKEAQFCVEVALAIDAKYPSLDPESNGFVVRAGNDEVWSDHFDRGTLQTNSDGRDVHISWVEMAKAYNEKHSLGIKMS